MIDLSKLFKIFQRFLILKIMILYNLHRLSRAKIILLSQKLPKLLAELHSQCFAFHPYCIKLFKYLHKMYTNLIVLRHAVQFSHYKVNETV